MSLRLLSTLAGRVLPVGILLCVAVISAPADAATKKAAPRGSGNPFDLLKGYWTGGGTVTPPKGNAEKVSCRVTYTGDGSAFTQNMRCAGTDYKFNTSSQLTYNGGKINGTWAETTYDASGSVDATTVICAAANAAATSSTCPTRRTRPFRPRRSICSCRPRT